jgi:hypothetical protein
MKLGCRVSLLLLSVAFAAGCGPSQADYDRAKRSLQVVTDERENLKSQLDQASAKIQTLSQQVTALQTAATAKPETEEKPKVTAKSAAKKKPAKARKGKKRA